MKFLILLPTHNEEDNIYHCLQSLENQLFQDFEIVVINDGSTDNTATIIENFLSETKIKDKIKVIHLEKSEHQPGAKVVNTFYKGLNSVDWQKFDIICKFDADIIFPNHYLSELHLTYAENRKAGMVSGIVKITKKEINYTKIQDFSNKNGEWFFENISSKQHIRGPIKSYRKACFEDIKGLKPILGWDNIDVLLAKKQGWEIVALSHIWVKHLRPTAHQYRKQKTEKLGEYFYNLGLNLPLACISALKSSWKSKSPLDFFYILQAFLKQKHEIPLSKEEIQFIRKLRINDIIKKFKFNFI